MITNNQDTLLDRIVVAYVGSEDFNGWPVDSPDPVELDEIISLVRTGEIEVITTNDFPNPAIRSWSCGKSLEEQTEDVNKAVGGKVRAYLYPLPGALLGRLKPMAYLNEPYRRNLAQGSGNLDCAYFRLDVLEQYRNDPRFEFEFEDFGGRILISSDAHDSDEEPESDKNSIEYVGFAYHLPETDTDLMKRYVCAFQIDLARMTPAHQQRWRTYEVKESKQIAYHPVWIAMMMGHWPDGIGPFQRFFEELKAWNELHLLMYGVNLLNSSERPREFGWVLRPSQTEYDAFVVQLDKLMSDNIRHKALDAADVPKRDGDNNIGTIKRLDLLLESKGVTDEIRARALKPFREVRKARQKPAHSIRVNVTDKNLVQRQIDLLQSVIRSIEALRCFWQTHPKCKDWRPPAYLDKGPRYVF